MAREEEKPRIKNEIKLINVFGRFYDACFKGVLDYEVVVVETSLNTFLLARCILALINFELARTIASCFVCFSSNDLKEDSAYSFHLESIFISA